MVDSESYLNLYHKRPGVVTPGWHHDQLLDSSGSALTGGISGESSGAGSI